MNNLETSNTTWIGSISWKADQKANVGLIDLMLLDQAIEADVLAFWTPVGASLWAHTDHYQPGVMEVLVYALQSVGESTDQIETMRLSAPAFKNFYGSYFVTRPNIMKLYIAWISNVIEFINTDRKAQNMVWKNSGYAGDPNAARRVYDLSFYPMHPFIGERLVSYFFNTRGYKILTACEYKELKGLGIACKK
jgi:hypothetical protein